MQAVGFATVAALQVVLAGEHHAAVGEAVKIFRKEFLGFSHGG